MNLIKPLHNMATLDFSFLMRAGFSSKISIAVIAALARYGGNEAEKT